MTKILVVGGGLTAAVTTSLLKSAGSKAPVVTVWDKAKTVGGRMSTLKCRFNPDLTADLGAQYISQTPSSNRLFYDELVKEGVFAPLEHSIHGQRANPPGSKDFVTPNGSASIVSHFFRNSDTTVDFEHHVTAIKNLSDRWKVEANRERCEEFDVVILTMPVPQILALLADQNLPADVEANMNSVTYSSRFAVALFFDQSPDFINLGSGVCAKYFDGDDVMRYMSVDSLKRNCGSGCTSVVFHTTVPFGVENVDKTNEEMGPLLLDRIRKMFPDWPQPKSSKCHKWRYSQASSTYPGEPGCVVISRNPLLIAGGDAFSKSVFDGCISSAESIVRAVNENIE